MEIFRSSSTPFRHADPASFVGPAETRLLASSDGGTPVHVYHVRFEDGARTNWHRHSGPQWLFVTEGQIRAQVWGQPAHDLSVGDVVVFEAGEKHWHGSVSGGRGVHLAMNVNVTTEWLEPVVENQYHGPDDGPAIPGDGATLAAGEQVSRFVDVIEHPAGTVGSDRGRKP